MSKRWTELPLRTSVRRYRCALHSIVGACTGYIQFGETYREGKNARAHERCVRAAADAARDQHESALMHMSGALAAGLFGLKVDRTKGGVN